MHSLGLQSQPLRHGRLAVVGTSVGEDDNEVGDVTAVAVSGRVHRVGDVAKGGGGVGCAVGVSCVQDGLLHIGAAIGSAFFYIGQYTTFHGHYTLHLATVIYTLQ